METLKATRFVTHDKSLSQLGQRSSSVVKASDSSVGACVLVMTSEQGDWLGEKVVRLWGSAGVILTACIHEELWPQRREESGVVRRLQQQLRQPDMRHERGRVGWQPHEERPPLYGDPHTHTNTHSHKGTGITYHARSWRPRVA